MLVPTYHHAIMVTVEDLVCVAFLPHLWVVVLLVLFRLCVCDLLKISMTQTRLVPHVVQASRLGKFREWRAMRVPLRARALMMRDRRIIVM